MSAHYYANSDSVATGANLCASREMEAVEQGSMQESAQHTARLHWDGTDALLMAKPCRVRWPEKMRTVLPG
jgi:hypothetical protein